MNNIKRQEVLDLEKWQKSYEAQKDLSGFMPYCNYCKNSTSNGCISEQTERVEKSLCAQAFNKMQKSKKKC